MGPPGRPGQALPGAAQWRHKETGPLSWVSWKWVSFPKTDLAESGFIPQQLQQKENVYAVDSLTPPVPGQGDRLAVQPSGEGREQELPETESLQRGGEMETEGTVTSAI